MISYSPIEGQPPTTFNDTVSYNASSDKKGKKPSQVKGIDRLEEGKSSAWKWYVDCSFLAVRLSAFALPSHRHRGRQR